MNHNKIWWRTNPKVSSLSLDSNLIQQKYNTRCIFLYHQCLWLQDLLSAERKHHWNLYPSVGEVLLWSSIFNLSFGKLSFILCTVQLCSEPTVQARLKEYFMLPSTVINSNRHMTQVETNKIISFNWWFHFTEIAHNAKI